MLFILLLILYKTTIMDYTSEEIEVQQVFNSPPRRRRSTFFVRRESLAPQPVVNDIDDDSDAIRRNEDLLRYSTELFSEKELWKKEVQIRRNKYHDLRQQHELAKKAPNRSRIASSYATLSTEDIEFLKGKPNLTKILELQQEFHQSVKLAMALYSRAKELNDVALSYSENRIQKVTDYILENSTIEPK